MTRTAVLRHEFVDHIPDQMTDGTIYICLQYATVVHRCCCGCGNEVVTPLSPRDWRLIFDGQSISLKPSVGNWSFDCQSHYWIWRGRVEWAPRWSFKEIAEGRALDAAKRNWPNIPHDVRTDRDADGIQLIRRIGTLGRLMHKARKWFTR